MKKQRLKRQWRWIKERAQKRRPKQQPHSRENREFCVQTRKDSSLETYTSEWSTRRQNWNETIIRQTDVAILNSFSDSVEIVLCHDANENHAMPISAQSSTTFDARETPDPMVIVVDAGRHQQEDFLSSPHSINGETTDNLSKTGTTRRANSAIMTKIKIVGLPRTTRSTESDHTTLTGSDLSGSYWSIDTHDRRRNEYFCKEVGPSQAKPSSKFFGVLGCNVRCDDVASIETTNSTRSENSVDDNTTQYTGSSCRDLEVMADTWDEERGYDATESLCAESLLSESYRSDWEGMAEISLCAQSDTGSLPLSCKQQRRKMHHAARHAAEPPCAQALSSDSYRSDFDGMAEVSLCAQSDAGSPSLGCKQERRQTHQTARHPKSVIVANNQFMGRIKTCSMSYSGKLYHL